MSTAPSRAATVTVTVTVTAHGRWLLAAALVLLCPSSASADPCSAAHLDPGAPLRIGMLPGGLGRIPEACPRTDLALDSRLGILVAVDDFYGSIEAGGRISGRYQVTDSFWLSAVIPGYDYRYLANATIDATSGDVGAGALGAHGTLRLGSRVAASPFFRVLIPSETIYKNAARYGFDYGLSVVGRVSQRNELVGGIVFPLLIVDSPGSVHLSHQPMASVDWIVSPWRWLGLIGGVGVRLRGGDDSGFESFDPRVGVRLLPWRGLRVELGGAFPVAGADRTDVVAGLNLGWVFTH